MITVAVTGATGFVGSALLDRLQSAPGLQARALVRRGCAGLPAGTDCRITDGLDPETNWRPALAGADVLVHLAARVHVVRDTHPDPLAEFRRVNVAASLALARQAAESGIKRFVFLSSAKVHGATGTFGEDDEPAPADAYSLSKHQAEAGLRQVATETGLEVTIVRPPLVYGPGVKANFLMLMRAVARGVPLPFGAVHNRRSLIALDNLVDFIIACARHPSGGNETFLVSDGEDLSTAELIRRLAHAMGRTARLISVPPAVLMAGASLLGRRDLAQRLLGSFVIRTTKARNVVGWTPPFSVDEGLRRTVRFP